MTEINNNAYSIVTSNYRLISNEIEGTSDLILTARIIPRTPHEHEVLGSTRFIVPIVNGNFSLEDFTEVEKRCDLNLVIMGKMANSDHDDYIKSRFALLIPKEIKNTHVDTSVSNDIKQHLDQNTTEYSHKSIKSRDGNTSVHISDGSLVLRSGDNQIIISESGITFMGKQKNYSLPDENYGLVKKSGMMRLIPSFFAFPPSTLHHIPDLQIPLKVSRIAKCIRKLRG